MRYGHEIVAWACGAMAAAAFYLVFTALFPGTILDYDKVDKLQTEKAKYEKGEQAYTRHIYAWYAETTCRRCHVTRGRR